MAPQPAETLSAEQRALIAIVAAIRHDYPNAAPGRVEDLLQTCYQRTSGARVQQYRLVLAERDVRVQLRLDERAVTGFRPRHAPRTEGARPAPATSRDGAPTPVVPEPGLAWT
jgi:hypothetical protein